MDTPTARGERLAGKTCWVLVACEAAPWIVAMARQAKHRPRSSPRADDAFRAKRDRQQAGSYEELRPRTRL